MRIRLKTIEWLGFKITPQRSTPLIAKNGSNNETRTPHNIKTITIINGEHTSPHKIYPETQK